MVLAPRDSEEHLRNVLHIHPMWKLTLQEKNDHLEAEFNRKKKLYETG
ncbi:MAG: hypothetical protein ACOCPN_04245 [Desulfonatronovibrionaceae bacterium]